MVNKIVCSIISHEARIPSLSSIVFEKEDIIEAFNNKKNVVVNVSSIRT